MDLILDKNDYTFWYKSVISCVEVYDKQIIYYASNLSALWVKS